ncbi:MAG: SDR family oxidoreductase [Selenomonadaceae bacterium]|nr:SDR family oxidoreductase [Selenomonadaceae bacterium]
MTENDYKELNLSTWRAMEKLYKSDKVRVIGVSNFLPHHLENIINNSEIPPMINQLEIHFWYQQYETVKYCQQKNILVESWGPFRHGKIFSSEEIKNLANKYNTTPEKFSLAWIKQRGILPIPKSSSLERILSNLQISEINFDKTDLETIASFDDKDGHEDFWNYKRQLNSIGGSDMNNLFDISGKVALITGASSGIGESAAEMLSSIGGGVRKLVLCARREEKLKNLAERLHKNFGVEVLPIKCDVSVENDVENAVKTAVEKFGRIDILLNCAGITAKSNDITEHTLEQWNKVFNTNMVGTYLMCREVAKHMKKNFYGKIINVTSMVALLGCGNQIGYSASKGGVISFTRSLAVELGKYNITVNAIAPGYIMTEMTNIKSRGYAYFKSRSVFDIVGQPEDLHGTILLLASDASRYLTGAIIPVDGGITANL